MAIGLDADGEGLVRSGIADGVVGDGGFTNWTAMVWYYRPSSATHATMANGGIIYVSAGARDVMLGFNGAGSIVTDPQLYMQNGGDGWSYTFDGSNQPPFDTWCFFAISDTAGTITARWRTLASGTWHTISGSNTSAGSQFVNAIMIGATAASPSATPTPSQVAAGYYYMARLIDGGLTETQINDYVMSSAPIGGEYAVWSLDDNSDSTDDTGNGRTITLTGTLTTETNPTLASPPSITAQPAGVTVYEGQPATFSVTATDATSYQWQDDSGGSFADISGATSSSLTVYQTRTAWSGRRYRVNVTNANGTTTSSSATLLVRAYTYVENTRRRPRAGGMSWGTDAREWY